MAKGRRATMRAVDAVEEVKDEVVKALRGAVPPEAHGSCPYKELVGRIMSIIVKHGL